MDVLPGDGSRAVLAQPLNGLSSSGSQLTVALVFADFDERPPAAGQPGKKRCAAADTVAAADTAALAPPPLPSLPPALSPSLPTSAAAVAAAAAAAAAAEPPSKLQLQA